MVVDASALILKSNYSKDMVHETVKELHCCEETWRLSLCCLQKQSVFKYISEDRLKVIWFV